MEQLLNVVIAYFREEIDISRHVPPGFIDDVCTNRDL